MSHLYRNPPKTGYYWLAFYQNSKLRRESLKTKDRSSAKYLQNKKDRELMQSGSAAPNQNNLCRGILEDYLSHQKHRRTKQSSDKSKHEIEAYLKWGNIKTFEQITEKNFQDYLNQRINSGQTKQVTLNRYIASVKAWLNYCVKMHRVFFNPLANVSKFKITDNPERFLSSDEIEMILTVSKNKKLYVDKNPTLYPVIATGIYAGPRPNELFNLEWQDIDFTRNQITIKNKEGFTIKTKKFRVVPLHNKLKKILLPYHKEKGLCFDLTNKRRIFGRILKETKLLNVDWYTLRHTFGSHAAMAGVPLPTISEWMGHSSITTTMIYAHLSPGHHKTEIDKVFHS